jgi:sortase A
MKKGRSTAKKWAWRIVFTVLVLVSVGLIFNEQIKNYLVNSYTPKVSQSTVQKNKNKSANYDFSKVKSLDFQTVAKARMNKQKVHVIGVIAIPSIKMSIPIAKGVSNEVLALAAGTMREDMPMGEGNYALAGHHMRNKKILFSPLYEKAKVGQKIYVSDMKHVYQYKLTQRKFIKATRVDVVNDTPTKKIITLITCDATGTNRLMIRGNLTKVMNFKDAPKSVQHDLSTKYTN